jgi:hypothetical protein
VLSAAKGAKPCSISGSWERRATSPLASAEPCKLLVTQTQAQNYRKIRTLIT